MSKRGISHQQPTQKVSSEETRVEQGLKEISASKSVKLNLIWASTLYHPDDLPFNLKETPDVFTSFRKMCESRGTVRPAITSKIKPLPPMHGIEKFLSQESVMVKSLLDKDLKITQIFDQLEAQLPFDSLDTIAQADTRAGIIFRGGESEALKRLKHYLWDTNAIQTYKETRNQSIGMDYSTKLSPYLALGCISPRTVYWEIKKYEKEVIANDSTYWVIFELLWRDFWKMVSVKYGNGLFYLDGPVHLGYKNESRSGSRPYHREWNTDPLLFEQWKQGKTGIPWVDAGMRELNATGFMSNRLRQNVASFLCHSLKIDWRLGAAYFESLLIDHGSFLILRIS